MMEGDEPGQHVPGPKVMRPPYQSRFSHDERHDAPVRILIVDDHEGVRRGFARLLGTSDEFEVVGEATNGVEAVWAVERLDVDVVLMDVTMPVLDGIRATSRIVGLPQPPAIVLCTAWADRDRIAEAVAAGVSGYVLKDAPPGVILDALRSAHSQPRPRIVNASDDHVGTDREAAPEPKIVPIVLGGARGRWQARVAGGVAAALILGSAGAAAASQGELPGPVLSAARFIGLPTPATHLDAAKHALARLEAALHGGDRSAVASAADDLKQRLRGLSAADQRQLSAAIALGTAEQRLRKSGDQCQAGDSGGVGTVSESEPSSDPDTSCGGSTQTSTPTSAQGDHDGDASSGGEGTSDGSGSSSGGSGASGPGSGGSAGTNGDGSQGGSPSGSGDGGSGTSVNATTTTTTTGSSGGPGSGSDGDSGGQGPSGGSGGDQTSGSGSDTSGSGGNGS
jgi:CheY-like chemotaxis protein